MSNPRGILTNMSMALPALGLAAALAFFLSACQHEQPNVIYMPDMVYSQAFKAQEEGTNRMPVKGTVPRDYVSYPYAKNLDGANRELANPLRATQTVLKRGQAIYNTYCIVCHGPGGEGDGTIVPKFPRPPSLLSDKIRGYRDGGIYHIITEGQNLMPSYAAQIESGDRWAAIHYIRALQRAKKPTPDDLRAAENQ